MSPSQIAPNIPLGNLKRLFGGFSSLFNSKLYLTFGVESLSSSKFVIFLTWPPGILLASLCSHCTNYERADVLSTIATLFAWHYSIVDSTLFKIMADVEKPADALSSVIQICGN